MTLTGLTREAADVGCQVGISDEPHSLDIVGHRAFVERFRDLWSDEFMIKPFRELDSKTSLKPKRAGGGTGPTSFIAVGDAAHLSALCHNGESRRERMKMYFVPNVLSSVMSNT